MDSCQKTNKQKIHRKLSHIPFSSKEWGSNPDKRKRFSIRKYSASIHITLCKQHLSSAVQAVAINSAKSYYVCQVTMYAMTIDCVCSEKAHVSMITISVFHKDTTKE